MGAYKDGKKWYVKKSYVDRFGNKKYLTKRGFATKREALEYERNYMERLFDAADMTFENYAKVYAADREARIKESTMMTKGNIIEKHIVPYFKKKKLVEITATDVMAWQSALLKAINPGTMKPYAKSYLKTVHNQLSAMLNHAVKYYGLKENAARIAGNMGHEKDIKTDFWTKEEYKRFSEAIMDHPLVYYCYEVLYWCGIREGELLALTLKDVNFETGTISVNKTFYHLNGRDVATTPKTEQSYRDVKMPDFLVEELKDYVKMIYEAAPTDRLFPINKSALGRWLKRGAKEAGVKPIRVHDLRHSHVSLLINLGYSAVAIGKRVGHKSAEITYRYAHMFETEQNAMVSDLNELGGNRNV